MKKNYHILLGFSMVTILIVLAIFAKKIAPYSPYEISLPHELEAPSAKHWLGCDHNGTDLFSALLFGARVSLGIGFSVTIICLALGLLLGSIAGWFGGIVDIIMMRTLDIIFAFPGIILAIALASVLGPSIHNLIFALACTGWAGYTRLVRGEVRALKEKEFILAARALGIQPYRIVMYHLWPNLLSPLLVAATFGIAGTIIAEASLSFLGIGVPPGTPSWGSLLFFGKDYLMEAPFASTFPGLAIMFTVLAFNILGEGLREYLDPKG